MKKSFFSVSKSSVAFNRANRILVGGVNSPVRAFKSVGGHPLFFKKGRGPYLTDLDENRYIDYVGSWGPAILGHAHPDIIAAAGKQIRDGLGFGAPHELETELGLLVQRAFPVMERVRFVNSGTEATLSAIRLARGYTGRNKIVKFSGCYHGHGDSFLIHAGSGSLTLGLPDSPGVTATTASDTLIANYNDIISVEKIFRKYGPNIAAVIIEPVAGNMGLVSAKKTFLQKLRRLCQKSKSILIFDEVMTGFRLAWGGAQELLKVKPDLVCLGKIIGGGFPVAAYGGPRKIMKHLAPEGPVYQAGTLSGHPVGMASGIAVLSYLKKYRKLIYSGLEKKGNYFQSEILQEVNKKNYPVVINRLGSMFTLFFNPKKVENYIDAKKSVVKHYAIFFHSLLAKGIYFPPSQFESGFISHAHDQKVIEKTVKAVKKSLQEVYGESQ